MISGPDKAGLLEETAHPLNLDELGHVLVIAPHPDDESLGCGGTVALLRKLGYTVHILFVSDGTLSHPNSPSYPADRLRQLRELEALEALKRLDVPVENARFMRQKDRQVSTLGSAGFQDAVAYVQNLLCEIKPSTVLVPWRRDPHPDHRASWQLLMTAARQLPAPPRVLEYLIWLWELGVESDMPTNDEVRVWSVDIGTVMEQRNWAIAAHQSQVTRMIDDDPTAFYLSPELLKHFDAPRELFLEDV